MTVNSNDLYSGPVILFDGVCNLCNASVDLVVRWDKKAVFKFASLQSDAAQNLLANSDVDPSNLDSFVYFHKGEVKQKSNAALAVAYKLGLPLSLLYVFKLVPRFLRNYVYDVIARNRYKWFGKKETCRLPSEEEQSRFIG